jgi:transposase
VPTEKVMASASLDGPARHRAPRILARTERWKSDPHGVAIKSWIAQTPSVEEVRPARCAGCGAASRPVGGSLNVHGQGLMQRQVRGVVELGGEPRVYALEVRRYECQRCGAVMTVVPAGVLARRQYSASSIALALHLWLTVGLSDRAVCDQVCAWRRRGRSARGWAQLYRWARQAASLFALPRPAPSGSPSATARHVLTTLRALAPVALSAAPMALQVFEGAACTR